jgi:thiamine transport system permease protein
MYRWVISSTIAATLSRCGAPRLNEAEPISLMINTPPTPAYRNAGVILLFVLLLLPSAGAFWGLTQQKGGGLDLALLGDPYLQQIIGFTLKQALLSAALSTAIALPIAWCVFKRPDTRFKAAFLWGCLLCFIAPTLVVVTGLVALLGRSGYVTTWFSELGMDGWNLYGLSGILLAHLFLNVPFAIRTFYAQLNTLPDTSLMLSRQLKLSTWVHFKRIEWPALQAVLGPVFGFIFILCFNSFAVVLALGGGPKSTTLEVAIYQALKYDFNIPEALLLSWCQLVIAGGLYFVFTRKESIHRQSMERPTPFRHLRYATGSLGVLCFWVLALVALVWTLPFWSLLPGLSAFLKASSLERLIPPTLITLSLGLASALISVFLAYLALKPIRRALLGGKTRYAQGLSWLASHSLFVPAMVLSVGIFIALLGTIDLERYGLVVIALLNGFLLMPFALQRLKPALCLYDQQNHALVTSLKLPPRKAMRLEWLYAKSTIKNTFGFVMVLAMGDVALFAIFGPSGSTSLPWLIYSLAGSYQIAAASGAALILLVLCAVILGICETAPHRREPRAQH